jgi:hypothetical protein
MTAARAPGAIAKAVIAACSAGSALREVALSWIDTVAGPIRARKMPNWPSITPMTYHQGLGRSGSMPI